MNLASRRNVTVALTLLLVSGTAVTAQAGLFDWLFPNPSPVYNPYGVVASPYAAPYGAPAYQQTVGYPPTGYGVAGDGCSSCASQPVVVARPTILQSLFPTVAGYNGQQTAGYNGYPANPGYYRQDPFYRSSWVRVPVTSYQPAGQAIAPITGLPVTAYSPCQTFSWQQWRVPSAVAAPGYAAYPTVAQPTYGYASVPGSCGSVCGGCGTIRTVSGRERRGGSPGLTPT